MSERINIDAIHKALANPVRREILVWLKDPASQFGEQKHPLSMGVCATLIENKARLSQSSISVHLSILRNAGLVTAQQVGPFNFFKRNEQTYQLFLEYMNEF